MLPESYSAHIRKRISIWVLIWLLFDLHWDFVTESAS